RKPADIVPAIDAVVSPDARLEFVGLALGDRGAEDLPDLGQVIGMHRSIGAPMLHRLEGLAAVFDQLAVHGIDFPGRRESREQARDAIEHDAERLRIGRHQPSTDSRTASSNSLRENGFGNTFFTPSRRAAWADPPRLAWKRAERSRIGAAYSRSERMS